MAADLHIHAVPDALLPDLDGYLQMEFWSSEIGNGYSEFTLHDGRVVRGHDMVLEDFDHVVSVQEKPLDYNQDALYNSPNVWVGEVSWLKAGLMEDAEKYIPAAVQRVSDAVGDKRVIDEALIAEIEAATRLPNNTVRKDGVWKGAGYQVAGAETIVAFLREHLGEWAFCISW